MYSHENRWTAHHPVPWQIERGQGSRRLLARLSRTDRWATSQLPTFQQQFPLHLQELVITPTSLQWRCRFEDSLSRCTLRRRQVSAEQSPLIEVTSDLYLGGERWYMNQIELSYSSSNPLFEHIDRPNLNVKLSTPPHTFLFPTPIGKSFECMPEKTVVMYSQVN